MDYHIEVITLPVHDVDLAVQFYTERVGFILDVDYRPNSQFRVVQLTPPGSSCSVQFGVGLSDAMPGSARTTYLVVTDIEAAYRELTERGLAVSPIRHKTSTDDWQGGTTRRESTPSGEIMPASSTSPTQTAIPGSSKSADSPAPR
jgi:predicted enzyme related to lactoylglutathione lyase